MTTPRTRGWWWKAHGGDYIKSSVKDAEPFVGWPTLMELVEECRNTTYKPSPVWPADETLIEEYRQRLIRRDQALIATLFLTGGRVNEVVPLRKVNFEFTPEYIHVKEMRVLKRYRKLSSYKDEQGRKRYITETIEARRGTFSVNREEPLVPYLTSWLAEVDDYLFESPATDRPHISDSWAYKIVRRVGERVGLDVWPHWFRSQRASQLVSEYRFDIHMLADWFKWSKIDTARIYTKLDPSAYEEMYAKAKRRKTLEEQLEGSNRRIEELEAALASREAST